MDMPKPTAHHQRLRALVGSWKGDEQMHPSAWDPKGGTSSGVLDARLDLEGLFLITDYRQERGGVVTYRGHGVYGWDSKQNAYTMYWFDSMGMDPGGPARGKWEGDTLRFEMQEAMGHSRYEYRFKGEGRFTFTISKSQEGKSWKVWLDSTWIRK